MNNSIQTLGQINVTKMYKFSIFCFYLFIVARLNVHNIVCLLCIYDQSNKVLSLFIKICGSERRWQRVIFGCYYETK